MTATRTRRRARGANVPEGWIMSDRAEIERAFDRYDRDGPIKGWGITPDGDYLAYLPGGAMIVFYTLGEANAFLAGLGAARYAAQTDPKGGS